jgi:hypothetical protein
MTHAVQNLMDDDCDFDNPCSAFWPLCYDCKWKAGEHYSTFAKTTVRCMIWGLLPDDKCTKTKDWGQARNVAKAETATYRSPTINKIQNTESSGSTWRRPSAWKHKTAQNTRMPESKTAFIGVRIIAPVSDTKAVGEECVKWSIQYQCEGSLVMNGGAHMDLSSLEKRISTHRAAGINEFSWAATMTTSDPLYITNPQHMQKGL